MPGYKKALREEGFFVSPRMRPLLLAILPVHTLCSCSVVAGLLLHDRLRYLRFMPELAMLWYGALGAILSPGFLVALICVWAGIGGSRPWSHASLERRERVRKRAKRLLAVLAFTFLAGGFLAAGFDLFYPRREDLGQLAIGMLLSSTGLFFISGPWLAFAAVWFQFDPSS